eukprot:336346_1
MAYVQQTSSQNEGSINDEIVDLSKFKNVIQGLKNLKMHEVYFGIFAENNVDDEAVLCLEKDDVKDLISKIGDRARFMKWLNAHKNEQKQSEKIKPKVVKRNKVKVKKKED